MEDITSAIEDTNLFGKSRILRECSECLERSLRMSNEVELLFSCLFQYVLNDSRNIILSHFIPAEKHFFLLKNDYHQKCLFLLPVG